MDGWMDGWTDGRTDGCMDGCMDAWITSTFTIDPIENQMQQRSASKVLSVRKEAQLGQQH